MFLCFFVFIRLCSVYVLVSVCICVVFVDKYTHLYLRLCVYVRMCVCVCVAHSVPPPRPPAAHTTFRPGQGVGRGGAAVAGGSDSKTFNNVRRLRRGI